MKDIDWGQLLQSGLSTGINTIGNVFGGSDTYPVPSSGTVYTSKTSTTDLTTLALVGMGIFFLVKVMER